MTLRQRNRRCGPLSEATTAHIQALPPEQLEALAVDAVFSEGVALLDFSGPADLATWLQVVRHPSAQAAEATTAPIHSAGATTFRLRAESHPLLSLNTPPRQLIKRST